MIHPTALIDPKAKIDPSAEIGPYVVIDGAAEIGAECRIEAHAQLVEAGALQVVSCDTVPHASNKISVGKLLAEGVQACLGR